MSNDASMAVESPPAVECLPRPKQRRKKQPTDAVKPKQQPPYAVVLFNDEEHTFQYVIETLMKVFGYSEEKKLLACAANPQRRQGHCVVGQPGGGRTQTGSDSFGWPGFLRGKEGRLSSGRNRRTTAGLT